MNQNRKIANNTIISYVRMLFQMVITFFATRITLNILGVENYGLYNLINGIVVVFSFVSTSMGTAVQRFCSIEIGRNDMQALKRVFGVSVYLHILIAIVLLVFAEIFAVFFLHMLKIPIDKFETAQIIFQFAALTLFIGTLVIPYQALLRSREEFSNIAYIEIIHVLLKLVVLYGLLYITFNKLVVYAFLVMLASIIVYAIYYIVSHKYEEARIRPLKEKAIIKKISSFTGYSFIGVSTMILRDQGIVVLLNLFLGLTVNAAYAIALTVKYAVEQFTTSFRQTVVPQLMASYGDGNFQRVNKLMYAGSKVTFSLSLLVVIPLCFEMNFLLFLWLKNPPEQSALMAILLLVNIQVNFYVYFMEQCIHATGHIRRQQLYNSILYIISLLGTYIGLKLGLGFVFVLSYLIFISFMKCISTIICLRKVVDFDYSYFFQFYVIRSFIMLVFAIVFPFLLCQYMADGLLRFLLVSMFSVCGVCFYSWIILFDKIEREKLYNTVMEIWKR